MNLSGKWKIKASFNEATGKISYRTSITQKNMDGETEFYTVFLNLVKDAKYKAINDNQYIIVKPEDAWLSFYKKSDGTQQIVAMVKDFEYEEGAETNQGISDDDLPF